MEHKAPDWLCIAFMLYLWVILPLQAWLIDWPAAVKFRNALARPRFRHVVR